MHVHSLLPIVGLTLITLSAATDAPAGVWTPEIASNSSLRLARRDLPSEICHDLPQNWSYLACYSDDPSNRALTGPSYCDDTGLAQEKCIEFCDSKGYSLAGVEFGSECYCGYSLSSSAATQAESDCSMTCTGNGDEVCGAGNRLNVFTNGDSTPTTDPGSNGFTSQGCYSDSPSARTLTTQMSLSGNVRVSDCTTACSNAGYPYAGLEYGSECYCGATLQNNAQLSTSCNMACTADKTTLCGGPGAINIYYNPSITTQAAGAIPSGWSDEGCYTDDVSHRALSHQINLPANSVTTESCIDACQTAGYTYAGLEWSQECYCDNTIQNNASPASSGCDMSCKGNLAETCGGSQRINIYEAIPLTCPGTLGCTTGRQLISSLDPYNTHTVEECREACEANVNCKVYQYGQYYQGVCNLYAGSFATAYAQGTITNTYCNQFSVYDDLTCTPSFTPATNK